MTQPVAPTVQVVGAITPEQQAQLGEARTRFDAHSLTLPKVEVRFGLPPTACKGAYGLFSPRADRHVVSICSDMPWVLVHELAHAWIRDNVDQQTRDEYLALRDLPAWNNSTLEWRERGFEDAAFVMQQLLTQRESMPNSSEWASRRDAFALLTNNSPVGNNGDTP